MNQYAWGMTPMRGLMYPAEYHGMYGHMYPYFEPEISEGMAYAPMYPEIYYKVYPYVSRVCDESDRSFAIYLSQVQVESMVNECYDLCIKAMPELEEYSIPNVSGKEDLEITQMERPRRPILRDLIAIILLFELFRRRDRRNCRGFPFDCGNGWFNY